MTSISELETALGALQGQARAYTPTEQQAAAILSRRSRGERIAIPRLPRGRTITPGSAVLGLLALAASIALFVAVRPPTSRAAPVFVGDLVAQSTRRPEFPVIGASTRPLESAEWLYASDPLEQIRPWDRLFVFRVERSKYEGVAAWMLLAGAKAPDSAPTFTDTTWVAREGLAILGQQRDTTVIIQPLPSRFLAVLQSADLSPEWTGSIPFTVRRGDSTETAWMNLKVYGTETVASPAGTFRCWKVGFSPEIRFYFWISEQGWPVQQGTGRVDMAYGKMNLLLVRREELE